MDKTLRLTLIRHAKSSWDDPDLNDFERPLNKRGRKNAPIMAEYCRSRIPSPDWIICSDAFRTKETALYFLSAWRLRDDSVDYCHAVYEACLSSLLDTISNAPEGTRHLAIIGHNPGMTSLFNYLVAEKELDNLPTCGIAHLELTEDSWKHLKPKMAVLKCFITPRLLEGSAGRF